jgi:hypothetical protein
MKPFFFDCSSKWAGSLQTEFVPGWLLLAQARMNPDVSIPGWE